MEIKVISDTHNDHVHLTDLECDILIHCGDFGTKGNHSEALNFLKWFVKQPAKYKILVSGNHDRKFKTSTELQLLTHEYGIHLLSNSGIEINGLKFWGGSFVPHFRDGVCQFSDETCDSAWEDMPDDLDFLITHCPPANILSSNLGGDNCGCEGLARAISFRKITHHVFGHIHEHAGKTLQIGNRTYYNCAVKDRSYLTVGNYTKISV